MLVPPPVVSLIDWAVLALSGTIAGVSLVGALYSVPWTRRGRRMASTRAFNYLWITRFMLQLIGALYALALDLRLQVGAGQGEGGGGACGARVAAAAGGAPPGAVRRGVRFSTRPASGAAADSSRPQPLAHRPSAAPAPRCCGATARRSSRAATRSTRCAASTSA
jgi:hypothetical protein